ncbi:MAG TPA: TQO small subunit DoxD [Candidatus Limnocylindrales bacterium]|nr:TQO small subunit DoxD [Candidatus Limnocylindrales bacterium]
MDGTFSKGRQRLAAILRIAVGSIFLTAGIQKAFLSEEPFSAVGFLKFGTAGTPILSAPVEDVVYNPTQGLWIALAGNADLMAIVNWMVVFGQIAIGLALILGLATRFASVMGTLMMLFFFVAAWEFEHGIVNQHLTYALVTGFIGYIGAGRFYGLDAIVEKLEWVRATPQLRYVLG